MTGSSSGIGLAIARYFFERGWNVAATARNPESLKPSECDRFFAPRLDVTDEARVASVVSETLSRFGAIDVLVNNAGYGLFGPLEGMAPAQVEAQFRVNVLGAIAMIRHVLPSMRARRAGTIVNVSSLAGRMADPFAAPYDATKYALEGLSESLRFELEPHGIRVRVVEPAHFKTGFIARSLQVARHEAYEAQLSNWMAWVSRADVDAPPPDDVARTVFRAAVSRSGRLRWPVKAGFFLFLRTIMPDAMWRSMIGMGMYKHPDRKRAGQEELSDRKEANPS